MFGSATGVGNGGQAYAWPPLPGSRESRPLGFAREWIEVVKNGVWQCRLRSAPTDASRSATDLTSFERHDPAAEALHRRRVREETDGPSRVWMINSDVSGAAIKV